MKPKTVVCSGGWRTGSTLVYNVARLLLERAGIPYRGRLVSDPTDVKRRKDRWSLYKCHVWLPTGAEQGNWLVLHTTRDPVEMAGSYMRVKGATVEEAAAEAMRQRALLAALLRDDIAPNVEVRVLPYEDCYQDREALVEAVAYAFGMEPDPTITYELAPARIKEHADAIPEDTQDPKGYWQPGHVGDGLGAPGYYRRTLDPETLARIESMVYF